LIKSPAKIVVSLALAFIFFYAPAAVRPAGPVTSAQDVHAAAPEQKKSPVHKLLATYLGGSANEFCEAIALDDAGNIYVTGYTTSADFPTTAGSYNAAPRGKRDVFIVKFDKDLNRILASVIIGGGEDECAYSIVFDTRGYVFLAGYTGSTDFPTTASAYCTEYNGGSGDAFILKMDKDLKKLVASTFLGGSGNEDDWRSPEIVQDQAGHIYIAGITHSADFPVTRGAYNERFNGGSRDVFLSKFDPDLKHLLASTFLGGSLEDSLGRSLSIDKKKNEICLAGYTFSPDFPTTKNAYGKNVSGNLDGFIAKFRPDLSGLTASTILPAGWIYCLMIHGNGDIYAGGHTWNRLPTTSNAFYRTFDKHPDQGFISRFSNDLSDLKSSTLLPGSGTPGQGGEINPLNLVQDQDGEILAAGWAGPKDFPSTPGAFDETQNGGADLFVLKMPEDLSRLSASTFVGGSQHERWNRLVTDPEGNIYVASYTLSKDFPTTSGSAFEKFNGGDNDAFVLRLDKTLSADVHEEFHDAAKRDQLAKVRQLLSANGERLERTDRYKRTALHSAARYGAFSVCGYLIEKGANVNAKDEGGNTPLHLAAMYGHEDVAGLLANSDGDINALNDDGSSPLSLAAAYGTPGTIGLLLSKKADSRIRDKDGNTVLHLVSQKGQADRVQEIIKYDPSIDAKNNSGRTPLHMAVGRPDNEKVVEILLDRGASLAITDNTEKTALHLASASNAAILLKRGAKINAPDGDGNTPLHLALMDLPRIKSFVVPMKELAKILLAGGADPNIKNANGKSPLDIAVESGVQEAIDLLRSIK